MQGTLDLQAGVGIVARPGEGPRVVTDIDGAGAAASGTLEIRVGRDPSADPIALVTFAGDSGLFVTGINLRAAALVDLDKPSELLIEAGVKGALLRVRMGDGDGFLRSVVPDLDLTFDAGLGFSNIHGAYFVGGSSLEISRAADRRIGPVQIRRLGIALRPPADGEPPGMDALIGLGRCAVDRTRHRRRRWDRHASEHPSAPRRATSDRSTSMSRSSHPTGSVWRSRRDRSQAAASCSSTSLRPATAERWS